jgi:hypothetical protein
MLKLKEALPYIAPTVAGGVAVIFPMMKVPDFYDLHYVGKYDGMKVEYMIDWAIFRDSNGRIGHRHLWFERWIYREYPTYDAIGLRIYNENTANPFAIVTWVLCWKGASMSEGDVEVNLSDAVKLWDEILKNIVKIFNYNRDVEEYFKKYAEKLVIEGKVPSMPRDLYIKSLYNLKIPHETTLI